MHFSVYELAKGMRLAQEGLEFDALRHGAVPPLPSLSRELNELLAMMMHVRM